MPSQNDATVEFQIEKSPNTGTINRGFPGIIRGCTPGGFIEFFGALHSQFASRLSFSKLNAVIDALHTVFRP
jgi:hypothetical protein